MTMRETKILNLPINITSVNALQNRNVSVGKDEKWYSSHENPLKRARNYCVIATNGSIKRPKKAWQEALNIEIYTL